MSGAGVVALFGAGVLSFANPCVLPLVPVWAGVSLGAVPDGASQTLRSTLPFIAGLAATFATLGAAAGSAGALADDAGRWLPRVGGALMVVFGLVLAGVGPECARRDRRLVTTLPAVGTVAPATRGVVAGVAAGAAWTPCVGPLLGSALAVAASSGDAGRGALLLAAYAVGIAIPFLVVALLLDSWPTLGLRLARRADALRWVGAVVLVAVGATTALGLTSRLLDPIARLLAP